MVLEVRVVRHDYRIVPPCDPARSDALRKLMSRCDPLGKRGNMRFKRVRIVADSVLKVVPVAHGVQLLKMRKERSRVLAPEHYRVHALGGERLVSPAWN